MSRFAVMKHISILEEAGFIQSEKRSIYRVFFVESWFSQFA